MAKVAHRAAEVTAKLYELMQDQFGSQAAARRLASIKGPNYFAQAAKNGTMDLRAFLAAVETLGMCPQMFFEAYFPAALDNYVLGEGFDADLDSEQD